MKEVLKQIEAYEKAVKQFAHFMVSERKRVAEKLREERTKKRISLRAMAKKLGISAAYLSDIELGRRNISITLYGKLKKLK